MSILFYLPAIIFLLVIGFWLWSFVYTSFRGSPYVPIKPERLQTILKYIKPGSRLADLGCGDGRVLVAAVEAGAALGVGWELDALVYTLAQKRIYQAEKQGRIDKSKIKLNFGDFWHADLSDFDVVYIYQMTKYMDKVKSKLVSQLQPGTIIISPDYEIPGLEPEAQEHGLYIYKV